MEAVTKESPMRGLTMSESLMLLSNSPARCINIDCVNWAPSGSAGIGTAVTPPALMRLVVPGSDTVDLFMDVFSCWVGVAEAEEDGGRVEICEEVVDDIALLEAYVEEEADDVVEEVRAGVL